jgi:hypothetical protein
MASVAQTPTVSKAPKAYRATLRDEAGTLAKIDGEILFFTDDGQLITIEPEDCVWLCVLGEVGLQEAQRLADARHFGAAWIATHRAMEVQ